MKTTIMASAPPQESDETETLASSTSTITTLHPDFIYTHILSRLDGATLAAVSSVSSELRHLCTDEDLWRNVCTATWPSLLDPIASHVISTFPGGYRSFFSDAFPCVLHDFPSHHPHRITHPPPPPELISAVDIYCQGKPVFSRVQRTHTQNKWFLWDPLCVYVVRPNMLVPNLVKLVSKDEEWILKYLQQNFSLSWIVIDPTRKRAMNLSSWKPVSVQQDEWASAMVEVVYAVVMAGDKKRRSSSRVQCKLKVTFIWDWEDGWELHVRKVKMVMEDKDGWPVTGRESLMILHRAMENGERKKVDEVRAKERFHNFLCNMS